MTALLCVCGHWLHDHVPRREGQPPAGYTYRVCRECACEQFVNEQGQRFEQGELTKADTCSLVGEHAMVSGPHRIRVKVSASSRLFRAGDEEHA